MIDFVSVWLDMWESVLGIQPIIEIYRGSSVMLVLRYGEIIGYVMFGLVFVWLVYVSARLLRDLVCGVVSNVR